MSGVAYFQLEAVEAGDYVGRRPVLRVVSSDDNAYANYYSKGSGFHVFKTYDGSAHAFTCKANSIDAKNFIEISAYENGHGPTLRAQGEFDTDIDIEYWTKGSGAHKFRGFNGDATAFVVYPVASAVNFLTASSAATGNNPVLQAVGSDTNVGLTLATQGTGKVKVPSLAGTGTRTVVVDANGVLSAI